MIHNNEMNVQTCAIVKFNTRWADSTVRRQSDQAHEKTDDNNRTILQRQEIQRMCRNQFIKYTTIVVISSYKEMSIWTLNRAVYRSISSYLSIQLQLRDYNLDNNKNLVNL